MTFQYIPMEPETRERLERQRAIRRELIDKAHRASVDSTPEERAAAQEAMARVREVDHPRFCAHRRIEDDVLEATSTCLDCGFVRIGRSINS